MQELDGVEINQINLGEFSQRDNHESGIGTSSNDSSPKEIKGPAHDINYEILYADPSIKAENLSEVIMESIDEAESIDKSIEERGGKTRGRKSQKFTFVLRIKGKTLKWVVISGIRQPAAEQIVERLIEKLKIKITLWCQTSKGKERYVLLKSLAKKNKVGLVLNPADTPDQLPSTLLFEGATVPENILIALTSGIPTITTSVFITENGKKTSHHFVSPAELRQFMEEAKNKKNGVELSVFLLIHSKLI
jgi:hypothetical protein